MRKYICWPHDGKHDQPVLHLKQLGQGSCSLNKSKNKTNIFLKNPLSNLNSSLTFPPPCSRCSRDWVPPVHVHADVSPIDSYKTDEDRCKMPMPHKNVRAGNWDGCGASLCASVCPTWKESLSLLGLSLMSSMGVLVIIRSVISRPGTNTGLQG